MGHAGLEAEEAGHVYGLGRIILGEGLDLATMALGTLLGVESHGAMAGRRKFAVRLKVQNDIL